MDPRCIVAESGGGAPMITKLTEVKWDHVFFTGNAFRVTVGDLLVTRIGFGWKGDLSSSKQIFDTVYFGIGREKSMYR